MQRGAAQAQAQAQAQRHPPCMEETVKLASFIFSDSQSTLRRVLQNTTAWAPKEAGQATLARRGPPRPARCTPAAHASPRPTCAMVSVS